MTTLVRTIRRGQRPPPSAPIYQTTAPINHGDQMVISYSAENGWGERVIPRAGTEMIRQAEDPHR